eukprot:CAMPEP_0114974356 /NCGR_PEP_ID=MMETSP0216-20121206/1472_1 /TAXON_ID=223996 /ORGANISM="Protocruzia adherens, Strain Boccale" /LENGTH=164 /DNA_ID=CAMNT_0002334965 /DNA_START=76 /DNA_END=570 /DNA_ORIENTATION=+
MEPSFASQSRFRNEDLNQISDRFEREMEDQRFKHLEDEAYAGSKATSPSKLPVKAQIADIQDRLSNIRRGLHENRKDIQKQRDHMALLEHSNRESASEVVKTLNTEIIELTDDLRKVIDVEKNDTSYLKNQIVTLMQDKNHLQQNIISVEARTRDCEEQVGVGI